MFRSLLSSGLASATLLLACGGNTTSIPSGSENAPGDEEDRGTSNTPTDPPPTVSLPPPPNQTTPTECHSLAADGPLLTGIEMVAESAPAPTGGVIPNGTYHLKKVVYYAGPGGGTGTIPVSIRATVSITGTLVKQSADGNDGTQKIAKRTIETFVTSGTTVTSKQSCPGTDAFTGSYSASGGALTLFLLNDVGKTVGYTYAP
jgi:hypothetical protein